MDSDFGRGHGRGPPARGGEPYSDICRVCLLSQLQLTVTAKLAALREVPVDRQKWSMP